MTNLIAAKPSPEMLDYLLKRRSTPVKTLTTPGPDKTQIETILKAAARVPDHGKLAPWYFIVFEGNRRKQVGELFKAAWLEIEADASPDKLALEAARFERAPVVIAVVSRMRPGKKPLWEQILSSGAAAHNLCLAANALGFGTNWLTEWPAFNATFKKSLGLDQRDHVAGFIYIGTPSSMPEERERPDMAAITTYWQPGVSLNKGDANDQTDLGFPPAQFDLSKI